MATFKCQNCGNLHGAPVETCGMCGSASVVPADDQGNAWTVGGGVAPGGNGPPPKPDEFLGAVGPLFKEALDYVRDRDERRESRLSELDDDNEETRRDEVAKAKLTALASFTDLCNALSGLAHAGEAFLKQQTPTVREPSSPIVE